MTHIYPQRTTNRNVPRCSVLLAETMQCSGEIVMTYYADADGYLWRVSDWVMDKPQPVMLFEACRLTGDTENMLAVRIVPGEKGE
jgi:hypothetical protein